MKYGMWVKTDFFSLEACKFFRALAFQIQGNAVREALLLMVLTAAVAQEQGPSLQWEEFHEPVYPQMARIAHIYGRVTLEITLQPDGTVTIQDVSGHPILVQAARDSIQQSKLSCEGCGKEPHTFSIVYEFKIQDRRPPPAPAQPLRAVRRYKVRSIRCLYLWRCGFELK